MALTFNCKKTIDLTDAEKMEFCELFGRVFHKEKSQFRFDRQFSGTQLGYSYHGLMMDGAKLAGCYSVVPIPYNFFGKSMIFGLDVDTMIDSKYRGNPFNLKKLADVVYSSLVDDGIPFVFGFPRDEVLLLRTKILNWQRIGELKYYLQPINIGSIKNKLRCFNLISRLICKTLNACSTGVANNTLSDEPSFNIYKTNDEIFVHYRYGYDPAYQVIKLPNGGYIAYRIWDEEGIRTAYLVDVSPLTRAALQSAVKIVYEREKNNIDVILYVGGELGFTPLNIYKVPDRFEPKRINVAGKILLPEILDERINVIENWRVNLSDFDVK